MVRRFFLLSLALGVLLLPTAASANSLVFSFGNPTHTPGIGLVRFGTGAIVSLTPAILTGVANVGPGGKSVTGPNLGGFTFSTGLQMGLPSGPSNAKLYTYAGGSSTHITITSNGSGPFAAGTLFTGYFTNNVSFLVTTPIPGKPLIHFGNLTAKVTTTNLSAAMLSYLGIPYQNHGTGVVLQIDVLVGKGGAIQSGSITLVPEPGTLVLFGSGLVTLAGLLRKRLQ